MSHMVGSTCICILYRHIPGRALDLSSELNFGWAFGTSLRPTFSEKPNNRILMDRGSQRSPFCKGHITAFSEWDAWAGKRGLVAFSQPIFSLISYATGCRRHYNLAEYDRLKLHFAFGSMGQHGLPSFRAQGPIETGPRKDCPASFPQARAGCKHRLNYWRACFNSDKRC